MKTLIDIFRESSKGGPDAVALYDGSRAFTYEQLDAWSDAIARELMTSGIGRGDRVALRRDPGAEMIAELLGILKSGACYVPLEVRNPAERSAFIARDAGVVGLLGEPWDGFDIPVLHLPAPEQGDPPRDPVAGACEWPAVDSSDLAYVIYTSGTTGTPKGVPITHGNVVSLLEATDPLFRFRTDDVWLLFHSIAFDFSVWEIWGAFAHGAAVVPVSRWDARDPQVWLATVKTYGVTVLNQTPTGFSTWCRSCAERGDDRVQSLRYIIFGGEALMPAAFAPWVERYGDTAPMLVNMYGITETTVHATFHAVTVEDAHDSNSVIGWPLPGFRHLLADKHGRPIPEGTEGELLLSGPQVTSGYLNRPELASERFVTVEVDGHPHRFYRSGDLVRKSDSGLVYLGRRDRQVKVRGHRIELGEIESAVQAHTAVGDVVADVHSFRGSDDDARICCTYTTVDQPGPSTSELRAHVRRILPEYMRPSHYLCLEVLPQTQNGKVDRRALTDLWKERVTCLIATP